MPLATNCPLLVAQYPAVCDNPRGLVLPVVSSVLEIDHDVFLPSLEEEAKQNEVKGQLDPPRSYDLKQGRKSEVKLPCCDVSVLLRTLFQCSAAQKCIIGYGMFSFTTGYDVSGLS